MSSRTPYLASRLQGYTSTIFAEMSALALATGSMNLGQGFPDDSGPAVVMDGAVEAIRAGANQYPPGIGIPELRHAVAAHQSFFYGLDYDPDEEVLVTAGATEALAACCLALCETGDEVVLFEPYYDAYSAGVAMAGASRRVVTLSAPDWSFDPRQLEESITPRTRFILLNSPHNPTGKVFSREELELVAAACIDHDLLAVTDEVYEHLAYDRPHISLASLPGMPERTIVISSAAKTFSVTGWKIGWACAPGPILAAVRSAKQFLTYVNGTPFQYAVAAGLGLSAAFYQAQRDDLRARRDFLAAGLAAVGFEVLSGAGAYFVTTDITSVGEHDGMAFCLDLPKRCGVVAVPSMVFYDDKEIGRRYVRWTFCKRRQVLEEAVRRLQGL